MKGILFVGSFLKEAKDGHVGGQMYACRSLMSSELKDEYQWFLIDSTSATVSIPHVVVRASRAFTRVVKLLSLLILKNSKIGTVLIFCSNGFSIIEKGVMVHIAAFFNKRVIIAPRSGLILNDFKHKRLRSFINGVFNEADVVICQGKYWERVFSQELNTEKVNFKVINNWIDPQAYSVESHCDKNRIVITYIGWLEEYKGIKDVIRIISDLNKSGLRGIDFRIAGMGSKYKLLVNIVKKNNWENVHVLGWVKGADKKELLARTDIYMQMSYFEGFPNSLLEAMACGKAVVSTNVGAVSDLVNHGKNGFIVEAGDFQGASAYIRQYIEDSALRKRLSVGARESVEENFSISKAVSSFRQIL